MKQQELKNFTILKKACKENNKQILQQFINNNCETNKQLKKYISYFLEIEKPDVKSLAYLFYRSNQSNNKAEFYKCIQVYENILQQQKLKQNDKLRNILYYNLGFFYWKVDMFIQALSTLQKSNLPQKKEIQLYCLMGMGNCNITHYIFQNRLPLLIQQILLIINALPIYFEELIKHFQQKDVLLPVYYNLALLFKKHKLISIAQRMFKEMYDKRKQLPGKMQTLVTINLYEILYAKKNHKQAIQILCTVEQNNYPRVYPQIQKKINELKFLFKIQLIPSKKIISHQRVLLDSKCKQLQRLLDKKSDLTYHINLKKINPMTLKKFQTYKPHNIKLTEFKELLVQTESKQKQNTQKQLFCELNQSENILIQKKSIEKKKKTFTEEQYLQSLIKDEKYNQAIALLQNFIKKNMNVEINLIKLGDIHLLMNDQQKAIYFYKEAINRKVNEGYIKLGDIYYKKQEYLDAMNLYRKAFEKNHDKQSKIRMVQVYTKIPQYFHYASDILKQLRCQYPNDQVIAMLLGNFYQFQMNYDRTIQVYEQFRSQNLLSYKINHLLGIVYLLNGKEKQSFNAFLTALRINPTHVPTFIQLAHFFQENSFLETINLLKNALHIDPSNKDILKVLVGMYDTNEKYKSQHFVYDAESFIQMGKILEKYKCIIEAQYAYQLAIKQKYVEQIYEKLSVFACAKGQYNKAQQYLTKILQKKIPSEQSHYQISIKLANIYKHQQNYEQAIKILQNTENKNNCWQFYHMLSECYQKINNLYNANLYRQQSERIKKSNQIVSNYGLIKKQHKNKKKPGFRLTITTDRQKKTRKISQIASYLSVKSEKQKQLSRPSREIKANKVQTSIFKYENSKQNNQ